MEFSKTKYAVQYTVILIYLIFIVNIANKCIMKVKRNVPPKNNVPETILISRVIFTFRTMLGGLALLFVIVLYVCLATEKLHVQNTLFFIRPKTMYSSLKAVILFLIHSQNHHISLQQ